MALLVLFVLVVPETRGGVILAREARKQRKAGNPHAWAVHDKMGRRGFEQIARETLLRPLAMLLFEPVVSLFALYDGLNYGTRPSSFYSAFGNV
jgi:DHA1 family multidrug resistance protein-like MFS transporter